jgi:ferric-dicitrate binding protein FerR (iron transport regulator)
MMNAERFEQLVDAYGARPERWPADERAAAERWLAASPEAAARLAEARALDAALDAWTLPPASAALSQKVAATAPMPRLVRRPASIWWAGVGLVAACAMGMIVGANLADIGFTPASATAESTGAMLTSSDSLSVFGQTLDLSKTS